MKIKKKYVMRLFHIRKMLENKSSREMKELSIKIRSLRDYDFSLF